MTLQYDSCSKCGVETIESASHRGNSFCSKKCQEAYESDPMNMVDVRVIEKGRNMVCNMNYHMSQYKDRVLVSMTKKEFSEYFKNTFYGDEKQS